MDTTDGVSGQTIPETYAVLWIAPTNTCAYGGPDGSARPSRYQRHHARGGR